MNHDQLDRLGADLQRQCNAAIHDGFPTWSRYAVDQMVDRMMEEMAPGWDWLKVQNLIGPPSVRLVKYSGSVA